MSDYINSAHSPLSETDITAWLDALPDLARIKNVHELDVFIKELDAFPSQLKFVSPEQGDDIHDRISETRRLLVGKRERLKIIDRVRQEVADSLESAQRLHDSRYGVDDVVRPYTDVANHIESLRTGSEWEWDGADLIELKVLKGTVEKEREGYLNDHQRPTTRQEGDGLVAQILRFAEQAEKNPGHVVTYFSEATFNATSEQMPVSRAIEIARTLLYNWWVSKIADYKEGARLKLEVDHQPRAAQGEIRRIMHLPGRDNSKIAVFLPQKTLEEIEEARTKIDEAVHNLSKAESELRRANTILESSAPDLLTAYDHYLRAQEAYPYVPDLEETLEQIVTAAKGEIAPLLNTADAQLKNEAWLQASLALDRAGKLLGLQRPTDLPDERARYDVLHTAYESVRPLTARPKTLTPTDERELLQRLSSTYANDYWPYWKSLARDLMQLQTMRNLQDLRKAVDDACRQGANAAELERMADVLADLQENPPHNAPRDMVDQLPTLARRIKGWLGYARARDELNKIPKGGIDVSVDPDDLAFAEVADLKRANEWLKQASEDRVAEEATKSGNPSLIARMKRLEINDARAERVLQEANSLLDDSQAPTVDSLERKMEALREELGRPNSHRQDLLAAYHRMRQRLTNIYRAELEELIGHNRDTYFVALSEGELVRRLDKFRAILPKSEQNDDSLVESVEIARLMARANRIEAQAAKGGATWKQVEGAWVSARDKAEGDEDLYGHALYQAGQARKRDAFQQAASARDEASAQLLERLTIDPSLQNDWEVWYRYGSLLFNLAQRALNPNRSFEENEAALPGTREKVEVARQSLDTAVGLSGGQQLLQIDGRGTYADLSQLISAADEWEGLLLAFESYCQTIKKDPDPADFAAMVSTYKATGERLKSSSNKGPNAKGWHSGLWAQVSGVAQTRLQTRLKELPSHDILGRFNLFLCLAVLLPDNQAIGNQMTVQSEQMLQELQALANGTVGDYSGAEFTDRYLKRTQRSPEVKDLLDEQLMETRKTITLLDSYRHLRPRFAQTQLPIGEGLLPEMADKLNGWKTELESFKNALGNAMRIATDGLVEPRQLDKANRILRVAQGTYPEEIQVPDAFMNHNHPTYRWAVADIKEKKARREGQGALRNKILALIKDESDGVAQALRERAGETLSSSEQGKVDGLRNTLQQLYKALDDMISAEPGDATQLQQSLDYKLPEDDDRYYSGAKEIKRIIGEKLTQYDRVGSWLTQWVDVRGEFQGIINWPKEKKKIIARRDQGPGDIGLNVALRLCREMLNGTDGTEKSGDSYALRPIYNALSWDNMMRELSDKSAERNIGMMDEPLLYGVVEPINRRRNESCATLAGYIVECEEMENNIIWRSKNFQARFDALIAARDKLLKTRNWFRSWEGVPAFYEFRAAVESFCEICPQYKTFLEARAEARRHTGREFYCQGEV